MITLDNINYGVIGVHRLNAHYLLAETEQDYVIWHYNHTEEIGQVACDNGDYYPKFASYTDGLPPWEHAIASWKKHHQEEASD